MSRWFRLLRYILIPVILAYCLLCLVLGLAAIAMTPPGLNPGEALVLRAYLLQEDEALNTPLGTSTELGRFTVEPSDTATTIGIKLVTGGYIANGTLFARYVQYEGLDTQLRAGTFFISNNMSIPEIARILTDPTPQTVTLTIIEGWRMEQIAALIDSQTLLNFTGNDFLALVGPGAPLPADFQTRYGIPAGASLEGFLFPATYEVGIAATAADFRDQMLEAFSRNLGQTLEAEALAQGWTIYEVLTVAAIVEREAVIVEERPQIAAVYLNRYRIGQKLDADPTVQYGIGNIRDGNWWPVLSLADYQFDHPYNTYTRVGLPPGPIANPSISSIRATLYPVESPYFFFRAACDGSGYHQFSITYDEHLAKGC